MPFEWIVSLVLGNPVKVAFSPKHLESLPLARPENEAADERSAPGEA